MQPLCVTMLTCYQLQVNCVASVCDKDCFSLQVNCVASVCDNDCFSLQVNCVASVCDNIYLFLTAGELRSLCVWFRGNGELCLPALASFSSRPVVASGPLPPPAPWRYPRCHGDHCPGDPHGPGGAHRRLAEGSGDLLAQQHGRCTGEWQGIGSATVL